MKKTMGKKGFYAKGKRVWGNKTHIWGEVMTMVGWGWSTTWWHMTLFWGQFGDMSTLVWYCQGERFLHFSAYLGNIYIRVWWCFNVKSCENENILNVAGPKVLEKFGGFLAKKKKDTEWMRKMNNWKSREYFRVTFQGVSSRKTPGCL